MTNEDFYNQIDVEIDKHANSIVDNAFLDKQNEVGKKSYGFLLWFLKTYVPNKKNEETESCITEGNDDSSCDIIFSNTDQQGELIYYVVQSKWFKITNISKTNEMSKEIKACLTDFRTILGGKKKPSLTNINFNERYNELLNHKKNNGKIKFLFVALCKGSQDVQDVVDNFVKELIQFELFDFFTLKKQFVELNYKEIKTHNPCETPYIPRSDFTLNVVKSEKIKIPKYLPHEAHILLIKPVEIYRLFEKYQFALFYKNIRNPLPTSFFNEDISKTIKNNPLYFWYFNNGITAITEQIFPFHDDAEAVKLHGIQIINGAQTVYSIYTAYRSATDSEKVGIDNSALITLRIVKTGGVDFDLNVTRYTNSQNPISERDFHANDAIQIQLQDQFLNDTDIWYETRRGEFRKKYKGVKVVSNENLGQTYLAYALEDPFNAKQNKKSIFLSNKSSSDGLYEKIFNHSTDYNEMYISYHLFFLIEKQRKIYKSRIDKIDIDNKKLTKSDKKYLEYSFIQYASFDILALMHSLLFIINKKNRKAIVGIMKTDIIKNNLLFSLKYYSFIVELLKINILKEQKRANIIFSVWFKNKSSFTKMKEWMNESIINEKEKIKQLQLV